MLVASSWESAAMVGLTSALFASESVWDCSLQWSAAVEGTGPNCSSCQCGSMSGGHSPVGDNVQQWPEVVGPDPPPLYAHHLYAVGGICSAC